MRTIDAATVNTLLDPPSLVTALHDAFRDGVETPVRHHHTVPMGTRDDATLLLMPAWNAGTPPCHIGIKTVTVHPGNPRHDPTAPKPSVQGAYLLLDGHSGTLWALIDGPSLTARRTAAASALAARFLSRPDARRLLVIGTGRLAPELIAAHADVRPIEHIEIWGRNIRAAERLADDIIARGLRAKPCGDLASAVESTDIISSATTSRTPVFDGSRLRPGVHVDLVGGFRPDMREADDAAIGRARIFVDTRVGAMSEAGDIVQPLEARLFAPEDILAELAELCRDEHPSRTDPNEITLFKSVGTALEDLAAAELLIDRLEP